MAGLGPLPASQPQLRRPSDYERPPLSSVAATPALQPRTLYPPVFAAYPAPPPTAYRSEAPLPYDLPHDPYRRGDPYEGGGGYAEPEPSAAAAAAEELSFYEFKLMAAAFRLWARHAGERQASAPAISQSIHQFIDIHSINQSINSQPGQSDPTPAPR